MEHRFPNSFLAAISREGNSDVNALGYHVGRAHSRALEQRTALRGAADRKPYALVSSLGATVGNLP